MTSAVTLPRPDGGTDVRPLAPPLRLPHASSPVTCRSVYAAAPVVADPWHAAAGEPRAAVDWDATIEERRRLWRLGFFVLRLAPVAVDCGRVLRPRLDAVLPDDPIAPARRIPPPAARGPRRRSDATPAAAQPAHRVA